MHLTPPPLSLSLSLSSFAYLFLPQSKPPPLLLESQKFLNSPIRKRNCPSYSSSIDVSGNRDQHVVCGSCRSDARC
ncbi:hypothetical protein K505DRAFT_80904 [Melanomma pulvis-pyrius CBS 109.77]|uniref:Uncharacterized protein n=1 Tax=Melanomma pulvis-pyrius CBS 109.77 TaxID=1314802 RepID=A0A6A6X2K9_9PLEO|nr:hypothetical protein K505DRAFT_80904 [Melanomma pulvis-pyrius CBS 109.77]